MAQAGKLSIETLKNALEALDWQETKAVLDAAGGNATDSDDIAEALRRSGGLVLAYPAAAAEEKRNALLKELKLYLSAGREDGMPPLEVARALSTLEVSEAGYRKLVDALSNTAASKLDPTVHVSAAIKRAEGELAHMFGKFQKQVANRDHISLQTQLLDESGAPVDMDSAMENFIGFVSMTLHMEAFRNKWITADGTVVVPSLPDVSEEDIYQAGSTLLLAALWRRWRMTEEKARVLGRTLRYLNLDQRPRDAPENLKTFIVEEGSDTSDWLHRVALERVTSRMSQNLLEIGASVRLKQQKQVSLDTVHALPPNHWISNEEVHGVWGLTQYLAYDIVADQERPGGLRLVEWVRGYCALMLLARDERSGVLVRTRSGWQEYLATFGLPAEQAGILIARLAFCRSSRDLFDHPFIKLGDGRYRLFALALRNMSVPIVVLSTLSHLSVQLQRKGKSFEDVVRETFEKADIKTYAFKAKRGDEEYEYDAVVPWGDYLFIIECKNRSLPFSSPVQMRYFDLQTRDNIKQVQRLMKGLDEHPDILTSNLPMDAATKIKVPVILNCFPYSAPGAPDGICQYDYSALSRFFASGEFTMRAAFPGKEVEEYGTGVRLWAGEKPTPEDLLAQLREPSQFMTVLDSLERDPNGFPLPPDWWVFGVSFIRHEPPDPKIAGIKASQPDAKG